MSCSSRTPTVLLLYITITLRFDRQVISRVAGEKVHEFESLVLAILRGVDELLSADRD